MGLVTRFQHGIAQQRGHLFGWLPVGMAVGIAVFFGLRFEPSGILIVAVACCGIAAFALMRRVGETLGPFAILLAIIAFGFCVAAFRTHSLAGPVIDWRYYGPVEGRIVGMDRSGSDAVRLTLDHVKLDRVAPDRTPLRVRISLHGDPDLGVAPTPGLRVMTTAHLSPPGGPVEPGGFDFQRHAWFAQLGAVGYTRVPLMAASAAEFDLRQVVFGLRMDISHAVRAHLPGDVGGFAAAVTTGDRSGISQDALEDLRAANTAHLLAISGLHMGLLSGFVFGLLRLIFALIPPIALRLPARKMAAGGALVAATGYLALSGGNVATERAFVMVAVALCAILVDRRAISLRGVAIAALIILTWQPEALLGPGFQMSFAATTALVAVFGWLRDKPWLRGRGWVQAFFGLVISSAVAGLATAPIGAAHFNAMAQYGLLANLASVPLMGTIVVPGSVLAALLAPFGAEALGLWVMGLGLQWILWVADWVAGLGGAQRFVAGPQAAVLPVMALGALFVILWQGRGRFAGLAAIIAALALWQVDTRPDILVSDTGTLVGVRTQDGRALSRGKGAGFVARNWLENDGDGADQEAAFARWDGSVMPVTHIHGKRAIGTFSGCAPGALVVASDVLPSTAPCLVLDPDVLRATGAVALYGTRSGARIVTARDRAGDRLWSSWSDMDVPTLTWRTATDKLALQNEKGRP
ncbi:ComEC/Rec2 family competence protein [uncultured Tateyamaria sp.]|uniref:ComEC/Rec2 family competence protein n=1 Tax=Tateyamaria sp. 1078 TaxID=3417464 RepID=UPI00261E00AA|nr:ComEC/Rec2 family competence protein [uncultured Tateyamaria sp.]